MKSKTDQLDFDFSRNIDFQRNLNLNIVNEAIKNISEKKNNSLLLKHLRLLILELYLCWSESESQFLSVSMSKRGYNSKSRYNPNCISSYMIRAIQLLQQKSLIEFFPGFYDSRTKKSRLSRIRASKLLVKKFENIKFLETNNFNHSRREFILKYSKGLLVEYSDSYETNEASEVLKYYNNLISKNLIDIPDQDDELLIRGDKKKIAISNFSSCSYSCDVNNPNNVILNGCWWNRLDLNLFFKIKNRLIINNGPTSHFSFLDYFGQYLTKISDTNIILKPKIFSSVLNFDQLCYLTMKCFRSKNNLSFFKSVLVEKEKYNLHEFSNTEIKNAVKSLVIDNKSFEPFFYKKANVKWDEFVSKCFFSLINKFKNVNIPIYLVRDKVYFPSNKESLILEKVEEVLFNLLDVKSFKIECKKSFDFGFENKGLFARFITSDKKFTKRYLNNLKYMRTEKFL